ncbi:N-methyltryptophan oxidase [Paractinoplanes deccanensis]|uniref:N-methyltryptophan oxidase n=1 Tax=Paractinoplanes deccanensis TaxID=113561 RepID=A0ABQ3XUJ2_9ACTN|nr:FAD-dependent oxidoreductase [Actinoplanes deccanensis]GID71406.1 N-methyltryptophan oxidase [Actinoplanes deccanensis]
MTLDAIIVGGGAMGSAAAWQLARAGARVLLLERFEPGHTRGASHGASRIFRLAYAQPDYIGLAREALELWRELDPSLLELTGGVDHGDRASIEPIANALAAAGVPGRWLPAAEATARWPGLRFTGPVLFHPSSGRLHADKAVAALQAAAAAHGATIQHGTEVTSVAVRGDDLAEVVTAGETLRARRVIVAAGAWTAKLLPGLLPLRVTQEQPAHFAPVAPGPWPSFIHHHGATAVYGLLTPGEGVKVGFHGNGPVVDPDTRDYAAEPGRAARLRDYVREWIPGVDPDRDAPISCTYTTTPTSDFVVDRRGPLVIAAGFSGHGFKFTPAIGRLIRDLALTGAPGMPRFAIAGGQETP